MEPLADLDQNDPSDRSQKCGLECGMTIHVLTIRLNKTECYEDAVAETEGFEPSIRLDSV